ncbi:MAG: periplasmic heavy metal sensor [Elusimicrobia bacterium]|nr:periplasmic heavy metal sensor [Elusimicrobiota bacterium]
MRHAICAALLASLAAVPLCAAETHNDRKADAKAAAESGHRRMADRMHEQLGLNAEQAKKVDAAIQEHRDAVKPLREALSKAVRRVHGLLEIEASDKDIQAALDQVEQARRSLLAETDKLKKTMETMLTPTQRAKMLVMREKMMRRGGGAHEGWRARDSKEERGARHGAEGQKDRAGDQEPEDD